MSKRNSTFVACDVVFVLVLKFKFKFEEIFFGKKIREIHFSGKWFREIILESIKIVDLRKYVY